MVLDDLKFIYNKIRIGQNAEENDLLIIEAKQTDLWFHLAGLPSCHVVLSCDNINPHTKLMINYCGFLVKFNTKFKNIQKIKVHYTQIKNVHRTNIKGKVTIKGKLKEILV